MRHDGTRAGFGGVRRIYRFHLGWSVVARASHFNLTAPSQHESRGIGDAEIHHDAARDSNGAASTKVADRRSASAIEHHRQTTESES